MVAMLDKPRIGITALVNSSPRAVISTESKGSLLPE